MSHPEFSKGSSGFLFLKNLPVTLGIQPHQKNEKAHV